MASSWKAEPRRRKQQQSIRDTVHHLLSLLSGCGVPKVSSECFRQAKFNQHDAVQELWELLFHIMQIINFLQDDVCVDTIVYHPITASSMPMAQTTLRHYLYELGYQREEFYAPTVGSRELLLAFVWLLNSTNFFTKLTRYFIRLANATSIPLKTANQYLVQHVLEETRVMGHEFEKTIDSFRKAVDDPKMVLSLSVCLEALRKLVWLKGQLDSKFKAVQRLCMAHQRISDNIHKSTYTMSKKQAGIKAHLSTYEVFLLRYPNQMKAHLSELGHRVNMLQKLMEWQEYEPLFWQWMESVLDLQEKEEAQDKDEQNTDVQIESVETLLLKVGSLQGEFEEFMRRKKSQIDRVEHVWGHKSRMLAHKDLNSKLQSIKTQLQYEYPITAVSTNQTALAASMVQQASTIDRPLYTPVAKQSQRLPHTSLQEESDGKLVLVLQMHLDSLAHRIKELEGVVEERRAGIRESLEALERRLLPSSLCKIESNLLLCKQH